MATKQQEGIPDEFEVIYVGCTPSDVDIMEQEVGWRLAVGGWWLAVGG
jgi:hypothetical protein